MSFETRTFRSLAVVSLVFITMSTNALALEGGWQAGINAGISFLSPDTDNSGFSLADDQSAAVGAYIGYDLTPIISAELAFTDLGEADLSDNQSIEYQAISLGATVFFWGEKEARRRSDGVSAYARLGASSISNDSDLALDESDNIALWVGLGIQYPFADNWGIRAEVSSFDGDAQALMAGVFWRTGTSSRGNNSTVVDRGSLPTRPAEPVAPAPSVNQPAPVESAPVEPAPVESAPVEPAPVESAPVEPALTAPVTPRAQIADGDDAVCPPEAADKVDDPQACALLSGVVPGLDFIGNTAELAPASAATLDRVVAAIRDYPDIVLEISAHTQSLSSPQVEAQLSSLRARAVARYLVQNGVPVSQLRAKAFGATQPLADTASAEGARVNNRIELRVL